MKTARDELKARVPGPYLLELAKNPEATTQEQIRVLIDAKGGRLIGDQLAVLALIVSKAAEPDRLETAAATEGPASSQSLESPGKNPDNSTVVSAGAEPDQLSASVDSEPGESVAEPPATQELEPEQPLDPDMFMQVDALAKSRRILDLDLVSLPNGELEVSWKTKDAFRAFVLTSDEDGFPKSISRAASYWHTREKSLTISSDHGYFALFGFSDENQPGSLIGQGRRLGEVLRFQAEEFQTEIRLIWAVTDQKSKVVIYKSLPNRPLSASPSADRIVARLDGDGSFVDAEVVPGEDYEYRAAIQWEGPNRLVTSEGKTLMAGVHAPVPPIHNFQAAAASTGNQVEIKFSAPESPARVKVFQVRGLPDPDLLAARQDTQERDLTILTGEQLPEWLGTEIAAEALITDGEVSIMSPVLSGQIESRTYIGVSILGRRFRVMAINAIPQVGDIQSTELIDRFDYQLLRVSPPPGAQYLEIWLAGESATFDQIEKSVPARQVQLADEYRRFGGVVFGDDLHGLPGVTSLGAEPKKIFIRGATNFEGKKHSGAVFELNYQGRIAVRFHRVEQTAQAAPAPTGMFGKPKTPPPAPQTRLILAIQSEAPRRFTRSLNLRHLAASRFPLDTSSPGYDPMPKVVIDPAAYSTMAPFKDENGAARPLSNHLRHRLQLIADADSRIQGIPALAVDHRSDAFTGFRLDPSKLNASLKVVVLGAKQSGKTTYVQALLNYLEHQFAWLYSAKLLPAQGDPWAEKRLREMNNFVATGALPAATRTAKPFFENPDLDDEHVPNPLRELKFDLDNGGNTPLRRLSLTDVAGEDMDQLETMSYYEQSIVEADLIILLADPLQLGPVQVAMTGLPLPPKGTDPHIVLRNLNDLLGATKLSRNPNQRFAVVFSKFDGFQVLSALDGSPIPGMIQPGMAITRDPNSFSANLFNEADAVIAQEEVLSIMDRIQLAPFIQLVENTFSADRRRFFINSSLGHASHADVMDSAGITSWRISDPIRWALHYSGR